MKKLFKKFIFPSSVIFLLANCSAIVPSSFETSFKYLGYLKGGMDSASFITTGKTTNDHMLSAVIGKDCRIARLIKKKPMCIEINSKVFKYKLFKEGKLVTSNNVVKMRFPSEIYDFKHALKKNLVENNKYLKKNK